MSYKNWILSLSFLMLLPLVTEAQTETLSSDKIKTLLEEKNAKILAAKERQRAAEDKQGSFGRSFLPSLQINAAQETFKLGNQESKTQPAYGAELSVNLYNGDQDRLSGNIQDLEAEKKSYEAQKIQAEELEKARSTFWQINYLQERISLLNNSLEINRQNLSSAKKRIQSGVATDSDRFEFEMKEVDLNRDLKESELTLLQKKSLLALLLGLDSANLKVSERMDHDHDYEKRFPALEKIPEYLFKDLEVSAAQNELLAKKSHRSWLPKVDAFAAYNQYNQREEDLPLAEDRKESVMGLRMTMSLSQGFEARKEAAAHSRQAIGEKALATYQQQETTLEIKSEFAQLRLLHDQIHDAEENIKRAENYYKMTQSEYRRGVKNSPDVLGASEKLFDTRNKRLEILKDFQIAKAHLLSKFGQ